MLFALHENITQPGWLAKNSIHNYNNNNYYYYVSNLWVIEEWIINPITKLSSPVTISNNGAKEFVKNNCVFIWWVWSNENLFSQINHKFNYEIAAPPITVVAGNYEYRNSVVVGSSALTKVVVAYEGGGTASNNEVRQ